MRIAFVVVAVAGLLGIIVYSLVSQARLEQEIEELRIQIREMREPAQSPLIDARGPASRLEKSSTPLLQSYL